MPFYTRVLLNTAPIYNEASIYFQRSSSVHKVQECSVHQQRTFLFGSHEPVGKDQFGGDARNEGPLGNEAIFPAMLSSTHIRTFRSTGRLFLCPHSGPLLNSLAFSSLCCLFLFFYTKFNFLLL